MTCINILRSSILLKLVTFHFRWSDFHVKRFGFQSDKNYAVRHGRKNAEYPTTLSRRCWRFNKWLASTRGCHLHASSFCWVGIRGIYLMFSAVVQPNWHLYTALTFGWKLFNIKYQLMFYLDPCSTREINFTFPSMVAWLHSYVHHKSTPVIPPKQ